MGTLRKTWSVTTQDIMHICLCTFIPNLYREIQNNWTMWNLSEEYVTQKCTSSKLLVTKHKTDHIVLYNKEPGCVHILTLSWSNMDKKPLLSWSFLTHHDQAFKYRIASNVNLDVSNYNSNNSKSSLTKFGSNVFFCFVSHKFRQVALPAVPLDYHCVVK